MKRQLTTITVDAATKKDLDELASEEGRSTSDIFREMYNYYMFKKALRRVQDYGVRIAERLRLETDDDVYEYLSKDKHGRSQQGRAA
jgi:predicted CopG family antitoxin